MVYCSKCGNEVAEEMAFCPKCGAALRLEQPATRIVSTTRIQRAEKSEKAEKQEKTEKGQPEKVEKQEKSQYGWMGSLIGGFILIFIGLIVYASMTGLLPFNQEVAGALVFIVIGIIIIMVGLYAYLTAARRHPRT